MHPNSPLTLRTWTSESARLDYLSLASETHHEDAAGMGRQQERQPSRAALVAHWSRGRGANLVDDPSSKRQTAPVHALAHNQASRQVPPLD